MKKKELPTARQGIPAPLRNVIVGLLLIFAVFIFCALVFLGVKVVENPAVKEPPAKEIFLYHGGREKG